MCLKGWGYSWLGSQKQINGEKMWEQREHPAVYALPLKQARKPKDLKPPFLKVSYASLQLKISLVANAGRRGFHWQLKIVKPLDLLFVYCKESGTDTDWGFLKYSSNTSCEHFLRSPLGTHILELLLGSIKSEVLWAETRSNLCLFMLKGDSSWYKLSIPQTKI